jgi:hypothetical protein
MKPEIFIGSSSEGLDVARAVSAGLEPWAKVRLWESGGIFKLGASALDSLVSVLGEVKYAALVLTADDLETSRGETRKSARDNVLFELGLCMGRLGPLCAYFVIREDDMPKIPSDLRGIAFATFRSDSKNDLNQAVLPAVQQIGAAILSEETKRRAQTLDLLNCDLTYLLRHMDAIGQFRNPDDYGPALAAFQCDQDLPSGTLSEQNVDAWSAAARNACAALNALKLIRYSRTGQVQIVEYGREILLDPSTKELHGIAFERPIINVSSAQRAFR